MSKTDHPPREIMLLAWRLKDMGVTRARIAAILQRSVPAVNHWFRTPERFDPYIDEVAIERALDGDRKVYNNLTYYERDEFIRRLAERAEVEPYDDLLHYPNQSIMRGTRSTYWLHELASKMGYSQSYFPKLIREYQKRLQGESEAA